MPLDEFRSESDVGRCDSEAVGRRLDEERGARKRSKTEDAADLSEGN
jgi:hypothetical protein